MNLLFPKLCLSCNERSKTLLCDICGQLLTLLHPAQAMVKYRQAAALPYYGPAKSLVDGLRDRYLPYLTRGLAAFLALQFERLDWPKPDFIVPVPCSPIRRFRRGYNQSLLLAKSLGKLLGCPTKQLLRRRLGDLPQTALPEEERRKMEGIFLKKPTKPNLTFLLVDDIIGTGTTLTRCAQALRETEPQGIYALAICKDD